MYRLAKISSILKYNLNRTKEEANGNIFRDGNAIIRPNEN